jgi:2-polyprenyl-3-methyl-5-hydroxy-6-metoxy-1,4-benzoquinol methylase
VSSRFERRIRQARKFARRHAVLDSLASKAGSRAWQYQLARRSRGAADTFELGKVIEINPQLIRRFLWSRDLLNDLDMAPGDLRQLVGQGIGGDWDRSHPLSEFTMFDALQERFGDGRDWDEIDFFVEMRESVAAGKPQFKYRTTDDFDTRFERMDQLWETLQRDGYRSQTELDTGRPWDEVVVGFDRIGRTIFIDGFHRLAMARIMGLTSIPAFVAIRHEGWVKRAREFTTHIEDHSGISYQPVPHPDLADLPSKMGHERPTLILDALPIRSGRVLDIGSNKGYVCHRFEDAGFDCVAAERSERELFFLRMFHDAAERRFEIIGGDVLQEDLGGSFDVVLALNIFHHFLKEESGVDALVDFLGRLDTTYMAFEPHLVDDHQMRNAYMNPDTDEFVEFVQEAAGLPHSTFLGDVESGRPLFLLSKDPLPDVVARDDDTDSDDHDA